MPLRGGIRGASGGLWCCGLFHATELGQALPSETAHFALFGYSLHEFPGRGPLEALGAETRTMGVEPVKRVAAVKRSCMLMSTL